MNNPDSRVRETSAFTCPVCNVNHRSLGWLGYHIRKFHPWYVSQGVSPAGASEVDYAESWHLTYYICDKCGVEHGPCRLPYFRRTCLLCGGNLKEIE